MVFSPANLATPKRTNSPERITRIDPLQCNTPHLATVAAGFLARHSCIVQAVSGAASIY
jgi:hypothetical protein